MIAPNARTTFFASPGINGAKLFIAVRNFRFVVWSPVAPRELSA
jgi:hypothetical protein